MPRPLSNTYSPFMQGYIDRTTGNNVQEIVDNHHQQLVDFYMSIPEDMSDFRYAANKWSIKEIVFHVIDTDLIFGFRALSISRGETQVLNGFDQDQYIQNAAVDQQTFAALKQMFQAQRESTKHLVLSFTEQQLQTIGKVADYSLSVNAACFVLFGHALHHMHVLQERYFPLKRIQ
ncbi:MAG: DNA damage-inducible protein DinB [Pseudopedobacter saltans]|uniref:DNA damage-inducible protein DinB n=1 Tax=Pseudopedobacter saltans TaxID=151895 RepID=A0A2W5EXG8_9SPHI|nr:MAG: DNA damage-inducible protein DinB [Pseudopedobacter saltans]